MARANKKLAGGRAKRAREAAEAAKQAAPKRNKSDLWEGYKNSAISN